MQKFDKRQVFTKVVRHELTALVKRLPEYAKYCNTGNPIAMVRKPFARKRGYQIAQSTCVIGTSTFDSEAHSIDVDGAVEALQLGSCQKFSNFRYDFREPLISVQSNAIGEHGRKPAHICRGHI